MTSDVRDVLVGARFIGELLAGFVLLWLTMDEMSKWGRGFIIAQRIWRGVLIAAGMLLLCWLIGVSLTSGGCS